MSFLSVKLGLRPALEIFGLLFGVLVRECSCDEKRGFDIIKINESLFTLCKYHDKERKCNQAGSAKKMQMQSELLK